MSENDDRVTMTDDTDETLDALLAAADARLDVPLTKHLDIEARLTDIVAPRTSFPTRTRFLAAERAASAGSERVASGARQYAGWHLADRLRTILTIQPSRLLAVTQRAEALAALISMKALALAKQREDAEQAHVLPILLDQLRADPPPQSSLTDIVTQLQRLTRELDRARKARLYRAVDVQHSAACLLALRRGLESGSLSREEATALPKQASPSHREYKPASIPFPFGWVQSGLLGLLASIALLTPVAWLRALHPIIAAPAAVVGAVMVGVAIVQVVVRRTSGGDRKAISARIDARLKLLATAVQRLFDDADDLVAFDPSRK